MTSTFNFISLLLVSAGCTLVACSVLTVFPEMCADLSIGKYCWFHLSLLFLGAGILFTALFNYPEVSFRFSAPDLFILLLTVGYGFLYHWEASAGPYRFPLCLQLAFLWFMLRVGLTFFPQLSLFIISITLCLCCVEAVLGLQQLFRPAAGADPFVAPSGSFFNAASYGGYLALLLPVSLCWALRYGSCRKSRWWQIRTLLFYAAFPALILIMIILPVVINVTTWLAATLPCYWIAWRFFSWGKVLKQMKLRHSVAFTYAAIFIMVAAFITLSGLYLSGIYESKFQPMESTTGRPAQMPAPVRDIAATALSYRASFGIFTAGATEKPVALLLLFLLTLSVCFRSAYKKGMIDVCGALLAAIIYTAFMFPHIRPPFLITLTLLASLSSFRYAGSPDENDRPVKKPHALLSVWKKTGEIRLHRTGIVVLSSLLLAASYVLFINQGEIYNNYRQWLRQKKEIRYEWCLPVQKPAGGTTSAFSSAGKTAGRITPRGKCEPALPLILPPQSGNRR